jgi:hypothetical protein
MERAPVMNKDACVCGSALRPRKIAGLAGFILSGATLVLMPKCPVCVAAYVALFTGVSVSAALAAGLRTSLICCAAAVPVVLIASRLLRIHRNSVGGSFPAGHENRIYKESHDRSG